MSLRRLVRLLYDPFFRLSKAMSRKGLYRFLGSELRSVASGAAVLSVGAGGDVNRLAGTIARDNGFGLTQLDVDPRLAPDIVADVCDWRASEEFDLVLAAEVLEHCHRPRAAIANLRSSLRKGGRLVLTVPFVFPIHDAPADYYRYTRHGLELLLGDFDDVVIQERNGWGEALAVLLARTVKPDSTPLKIASPLFVVGAALASPPLWLIGRVLPAGFVTTGYNVSATKPL